MADLFISYAREDRVLTSKVIALVEARGYSTWWDDGLHSGANVAREIQRQIDESKAVLVPADMIPLPYNALHCLDVDDIPQIVASLQRRGVTPSNPEKVWDFYAEPIDVRRAVCDKLARIHRAYLSQLTGERVLAMDPSMDMRLDHTTLYEYDRSVPFGEQTLRLHPMLDFTRFRDSQLRFLEPPDSDEAYHDLFNNVIRRIGYKRHLSRFGFTVSMVINLTPFNPFLYPFSPAFRQSPFGYVGIERMLLEPYLVSSPPTRSSAPTRAANHLKARMSTMSSI